MWTPIFLQAGQGEDNARLAKQSTRTESGGCCHQGPFSKFYRNGTILIVQHQRHNADRIYPYRRAHMKNHLDQFPEET